MTQQQINHYRALWSNARRVLRDQGLSSKACEERRHEIHREKLGRDVSSTKLTNKQFDKIKGAFLAISQPADLQAQLQAEDGDCIRARHVVATLCAEIGYDDEQLQGTIDHMQREGRLRDPDRPRANAAAGVSEWDVERQRDYVPRLTLTDLDAGELETVIIALRLQAGRVEEQRAAEHAAPAFKF